MKLRGLHGGAPRAALALALLVLQIAAVLTSLSRSGSLRPNKVADTQSYLVAANSTTVGQALSHYRTYGYPLFLKTVGPLKSRLGLVPAVQTGAFFAAVLLFWLAVWRYSGSPWLALAAATPLPYALILDLAGVLQPDLLSAAFALAAVSFLLLLELRPSSAALWTALVLAVFASYQLRPASVFLVGLVPCAGLVLRWCRRPSPGRRLLRWTGALALATALPYLAFSTLRWATVGHFGLVSFGACNLSAATAGFLDHDLIRELPREQHRLARKILAKRRLRGFAPLRLGDDTLAWFAEQYNDNLWRVTMPEVRERLRHERRLAREAAAAGQEAIELDPRPDQIVINDRLGRLSGEIIRRRPRLYGQWVRDSLAFGLAQLAGQGWIFWPGLLVVCAVPWTWIGGVRPAGGGAASADRRPLGLFLLGAGYFAVCLLLLSLVTFPFVRYFASAILLLPSALCVELFELARRLRMAPAA